jgi:hypothetical protein
LGHHLPAEVLASATLMVSEALRDGLFLLNLALIAFLLIIPAVRR